MCGLVRKDEVRNERMKIRRTESISVAKRENSKFSYIPSSIWNFQRISFLVGELSGVCFAKLIFNNISELAIIAPQLQQFAMYHWSEVTPNMEKIWIGVRLGLF